MKTYNINGKQIEFDETKTYLDFYLVEGEGTLPVILFDKMLTAIESKEVPIDEDLKRYFTHLNRWVKEAPRKRHFRQMRADGMIVLSDEQFFDNEGGDKVIDYLENTGHLAEYLLKELFV